jgi:LAO/AO transport system kinase
MSDDLKTTLDGLIEQFRQHDRFALSRLVTVVGRGQYGGYLLSQIGSAAKRARVVAITGSAGVGKSTLIGKLIETIREQGLTVAVLACDPESPLTGGALLGDRFRMGTGPDDGVFIRSLAATGGHGAVAEHLADVIPLLERFGFDVVLIETVGAGQGDTSVRNLADVVVLLLQPETGDDIQWEKAGVLEVADVIVIHKGDLPGATNVEGQVKQTLALSGAPAPTVLRVSSRSGEGMAQLWHSVAALPLRKPGQRETDAQRRLADAVLAEVQARLRATNPEATQRILSNYFERGLFCPAEAASQLVRLVSLQAPTP